METAIIVNLIVIVMTDEKKEEDVLTFCLSMHSLYEAPLSSPSSTSVRQLDVMSTSWNELLRH